MSARSTASGPLQPREVNRGADDDAEADDEEGPAHAGLEDEADAREGEADGVKHAGE